MEEANCEGFSLPKCKDQDEPLFDITDFDLTSFSFWKKQFRFLNYFSYENLSPRDLPQVPLISRERHTTEQNFFYNIHSFYGSMMPKEAPLQPFTHRLMEHLLLLENNYNVSAITQIDSLSPLQNEIVQKIYRFFPVPNPEDDFYSNSVILDKEFRFLYNLTRHNPLLLYSYATYVQMHLLQDHMESGGFLPSINALDQLFLDVVAQIKNLPFESAFE